MTVRELKVVLGGTLLTHGESADRTVACGFACDLLSWVMAHGKPGMAWVTVQAHMNVIAVAVLADMACVIIAEGVAVDTAVIEKADAEGIAIISASKSAYEIAGCMYNEGILP